jgi:ribosomal-protein-alanine N-acetyltransferase
VPELQRLRAGHAPAVLAFERANRAYFAAAVSDRGDAFYERFDEHMSTLLARQEAGLDAYHVLVADDGSVVGRFNLYDIDARSAVVGYRVAEHVAGRGVATRAVRDLCRLAASRYGLRTLRAAAADDNPASRRVLLKAGFVAVGPADPADVGGKAGTWYRLELGASPPQ